MSASPPIILQMATAPDLFDKAKRKSNAKLNTDIRSGEVLEAPKDAVRLPGSAGNGAMLTVLVWLQVCVFQLHLFLYYYMLFIC